MCLSDEGSNLHDRKPWAPSLISCLLLVVIALGTTQAFSRAVEAGHGDGVSCKNNLTEGDLVLAHRFRGISVPHGAKRMVRLLAM